MDEFASRPPWLVAQENGTISEARTRSFLLDRFWILERSVDIEGADFIIQRRITRRSLLDKRPPRLGVVQAKYFESPLTTQYVHKEYILDDSGRPRPEFFLVCHTGKEDGARAFFLAAADIANRFSVTSATHSRPDRFELPGRTLLAQEFEILDRKQILSRMEQAIVNAEFVANRTFLSWALPIQAEGEVAIEPDYLEPIPNW